jgi:hypothetical protein
MELLSSLLTPLETGADSDEILELFPLVIQAGKVAARPLPAIMNI